MSDLLTHWAVFDDARRLASQDVNIEPLFNQILSEASEFSRLGALARGGSKWTAHLLHSARQNPAPDNARWRQKLGFALGGLLHYPADFIFKPMMSRLAKADWNLTHVAMQGHGAESPQTQNKASIREVSAYFDCHVFKLVYLAGHEEPFSQFFLAHNATEPGRELELFTRALFQRALLSSHTLAPPREDFDGWLDNLLDKVQPLYLEMALYNQVWSHPDPEKMAFYGVETEFYRDSDPLIQLARSVQNGETISPAPLESALREGANTSGYGQCLRLGVEVLREASAFWRGEVETPPDVSQG